ncbi:hypothetical protein KKG65_04090 [Patescibacteria group bacterium]|nr:hypothetical protein [Patescibacteria group bacterium]
MKKIELKEKTDVQVLGGLLKRLEILTEDPKLLLEDLEQLREFVEKRIVKVRTEGGLDLKSE